MEFHFAAKKVTAKGKGALAVSAYISGRTAVDGLRINNPHKPGEVLCGGLELPPGAHFRDTRELWRKADLAERKKDGTYQMRGGNRQPSKDGKPRPPGKPVLASHADLAVPWSTTEDQAREIARRVCRHLTERHGVGVEWAVHVKDGRIDHIHFLWTSRTLSDKGFGGKARTFNAIAVKYGKAYSDKPENPMSALRWEAAQAIKDTTGVWWDPRSFKERGIQEMPEPKIDRRELRRQKREAAKAGRAGPAPLEAKLTKFRELKRERRALLDEPDIEISEPAPTRKPVAPHPGAARPGVAAQPPKAPVESYRVDPLRGADGKPRSLRFQTTAATLLYSLETNDRPLFGAASKLFELLLNTTAEAVQKLAQGLVAWAAENGGRQQLPPPLTSTEACKALAAEIKAARAAKRAKGGRGIGD